MADNDLNTMLLEHARTGLKSRLDQAVTNGDTAEAEKVTAEMVKLATASAPKPATGGPAYGNPEIVAAMEAKADWYGVDPKKSEIALRLGKSLSPKKFATAELFADALIKAVDEELKPAAAVVEDGDDEEGDEDEEDSEKEKPKPKPKRTDSQSGEGSGGTRSRTTSGPWKKISDAPNEIRADINRQADKFAPKTEDGRKKFIEKALESHYNAAQQRKKAQGK